MEKKRHVISLDIGTTPLKPNDGLSGPPAKGRQMWGTSHQTNSLSCSLCFRTKILVTLKSIIGIVNCLDGAQPWEVSAVRFGYP